MADMTVYEYVTADNGTVHLVPATRPGAWSPPRTLCGRGIAGWTMGDETLAGLVATCLTCKHMAGSSGASVVV